MGIKVKDPSKWVAITVDDKVIAESSDANKVIQEADKSGLDYTLQYVHDPNRSYIF